MEQVGEVSYGGGSGWNQRRTPELGDIQEEFDDTTAGTPSRKDDGGGPEVGHGPLDVVLDEVGRGCGQRGLVPPEEHTLNDGCQGSLQGLESGCGFRWEAT